MQENIVGFEVALMSEPTEAHLTLKLWFHPTFVLNMTNQMSFLLVRRIAVGTHETAILILSKVHVPKN